MQEQKIRFFDFHDIPTGGFSCKAFSTRFDRVDQLEFALSPNPGRISADNIAVALSTLCGRSYGVISLELEVSDECARFVESYTHAVVEVAGRTMSYVPCEGGENCILNFSGGFDSLAAYSLMPKDETRLVSIDWGGHFFREEQFFRKFKPFTLTTNIQRLGYCRETWTFMGIGMILFSKFLDAGYGVFGGNFEASQGQMTRCPLIARVSKTEPFSFCGIKDMRVTNGLTEIGSLMTVMRHSPELFLESLRSVAAPGSEKAYRKSVLSYIVNEKFGGGLSIPIQNAPVKPAYEFGRNVAIDMLCLYEVKNVGRGIASKTVANIPADVEKLVDGLSLSFFERFNTNFLNTIPSRWQDLYVSQLVKAGICPYEEEDWYELDTVCGYLSQWYPLFTRRAEDSQIGKLRQTQQIPIPNDVTLWPKQGPYNWAPITSSLQASGKYRLSVDLVEVVAGNPQSIWLRLYDLNSKKSALDKKFTIKKEHGLSNLTWEFVTPAECGDCRVIAYAGAPGECDGVGVSYRGIQLDGIA